MKFLMILTLFGQSRILGANWGYSNGFIVAFNSARINGFKIGGSSFFGKGLLSGHS